VWVYRLNGRCDDFLILLSSLAIIVVIFWPSHLMMMRTVRLTERRNWCDARCIRGMTWDATRWDDNFCMKDDRFPPSCPIMSVVPFYFPSWVLINPPPWMDSVIVRKEQRRSARRGVVGCVGHVVMSCLLSSPFNKNRSMKFERTGALGDWINENEMNPPIVLKALLTHCC